MIVDFVFVAVLLVAAVVLREKLRWLASLRIPASLLAGTIGLVLFQLAPSAANGESSPGWLDAIANDLRSWPGPLIAVVFAGMLLAKSGSRQTFTRSNLRRAGRQGLMVWIIVLGQTAVGLWVTWLVIQPRYDLPNSTGMLIETGFAGGHGTAAAMGTVLGHPSIGLESGLDLGLLMATAGLAYGLVSGVVWVNIAVRRGWVESPSTEAASTQLGENAAQKAGQKAAPRAASLGTPRISGETIDPLLLQVVWIALAFAVGLAIQQSIEISAIELDRWIISTAADATASGELNDKALRERLSFGGVLGSFPLFIYTLFGGAIVRCALTLVGQKERIDSQTIHRLVASAMDVLVVAAVATLNLQVVASLWFPFASLFIAGALWCTFCLVVLSRWVLPESIWFHLGIINYGMSTGTTATGFVLLRTVDPELRSGAAEDYALAAPLSAPFIGGGMITVALPLLVLERAPIWASALAITVVVLLLIGIGVRLRMLSSISYSR